jgi:hypothetical protein
MSAFDGAVRSRWSSTDEANRRTLSVRPSGGTLSTPTTERIYGSENCCVPLLYTSPPRSPGSRL